MNRLWPGGLAARLVVLLVSALAVAQAVVVFVLYDEQRGVVETMARGLALNQAVALARLLTTYPNTEADHLVASFGSRMTCARVVRDVDGDRPAPANDTERRLTERLGRMLHGSFSGPPSVTLRHTAGDTEPCAGVIDGEQPRFATPGKPPRRPEGAYAAEMTIPLNDGRTLVYTSFIEGPDVPKWVAGVSFLISAFAVGIVALVSVRHQTSALRELADAAERLGRGEDVPPLTAKGPIEIALAISAFDTMRDRLHRYMSDRLKLLAAVSHDLRTPLTTLRLKAEFTEDEAVRDDLVATIDELTAITESTLTFSRAEASHEATEIVDLAELLAEVVDEFRLNYADVTILPREEGAAIRTIGRPVALRRAVRNVIDNAIRYGRRARIAIAVDELGVLIRIEDDGAGISEAHIEAAFEPFVRLEPSRSRETGGTGLGLPITRNIVQRHGGTIRLINRLEGGLTVEIRLPAIGP